MCLYLFLRIPMRGLYKARAVMGRGIPGGGEVLEVCLEGQGEPQERMAPHARDGKSEGVVAKAVATAAPRSPP